MNWIDIIELILIVLMVVANGIVVYSINKMEKETRRWLKKKILSDISNDRDMTDFEKEVLIEELKKTHPALKKIL